jgi:hypothetical protein
VPAIIQATIKPLKKRIAQVIFRHRKGFIPSS